MQFEQIETLLEKYYNGETSLEEENKLQTFFQQTKLLPDHLKPEAAQFRHFAQGQKVEMDRFLADDWLFEKIENPALSVQGRAQKTERTSFFKNYAWQIAASISLLIVAFWAGNYFNQTESVPVGNTQVVAQQQKTLEARPEIETSTQVESPVNTAMASGSQKQEDAEEAYTSVRRQPARPVLVAGSTLRSSSASDRLQLVSQNLQTEGLTAQESKKIIKLLVKTMNQDGNLNVRLAACEALYQFKDHKEVRKAFIHALGTQTEPLMQLTLIEMVVKMKEATAVPQLERLMHKEDLLPIVKYKAQEGLGTLI